MRKLFFEVRHGRLSTLPNSLAMIVGSEGARNAVSVFVSEAGTLLNEPDKRIIAPILPGARPSEVIGRMAEAIAWVFDRLESELDQDFQYNYLKLAFIQLNSIHAGDAATSGMMSTIFPELPETLEASPQMVLHQMTTAIRTFCSHVRAAVELGGWESDVFACDWATMTFNKSQ